MVFTIVFEGISKVLFYLDISQIDWSDHSALEIIRIICIFIGLLVSVFFLIPLRYYSVYAVTFCTLKLSTAVRIKQLLNVLEIKKQKQRVQWQAKQQPTIVKL